MKSNHLPGLVMKSIVGVFASLIFLIKISAAPEIPQGLEREEQDAFWHLSEGADVFPYGWAVYMKNLVTNSGKTYLEGLGQYKIVSDGRVKSGQSDYLIPWVGISAAWSDVSEGQRDIRKSQLNKMKLNSEDIARSYQILQDLQGHRKVASVAMMGTTCSLCHTNQIQVGDRSVFIEGAGSTFDARGLFKDMAGSTILTMLKSDQLRDFLLHFGYGKGEASQVAAKFVCDFKNALHLPGWARRQMTGCRPGSDFSDDENEQFRSFLESLVNDLKKSILQRHLLKYRPEVQKYLVRLLEITVLKNSPQPVSEELKARMWWLTNLISVYPQVSSSLSGHGRTDAFGRIGNTVARFDDPIPLSANVSLPSIWAIKYRDFFHYNANTNSVLMRNVGQSFGLGAVLVKSGSFRATTNFGNLGRLENLIYKIKVPRWSEVMESPIDEAYAQNGCKIYVKTCMGCHEARKERVGPTGELLSYHVLPLGAVGTDPNQAVFQTKPIGNKPLREVLFGFTQAIRDQFLSDHQEISPSDLDQQLKWRGQELFRDTFLGESEANGRTGLSYINIPPQSGYASRHLAGVWATPPYLHNGSVRSIDQLLMPPTMRDKQFVIDGVYNEETLGYGQPTLEEQTAICERQPEKCFAASDTNSQSVVNQFYRKLHQGDEVSYKDILANDGNSILGHYFVEAGGDESRDFRQFRDWRKRRELIEFLKVLEPEPEYGGRVWKRDCSDFKPMNESSMASDNDWDK